jgi:hypothetical protein
VSLVFCEADVEVDVEDEDEVGDDWEVVKMFVVSAVAIRMEDGSDVVFDGAEI